MSTTACCVTKLILTTTCFKVSKCTFGFVWEKGQCELVKNKIMVIQLWLRVYCIAPMKVKPVQLKPKFFFISKPPWKKTFTEPLILKARQKKETWCEYWEKILPWITQNRRFVEDTSNLSCDPSLLLYLPQMIWMTHGQVEQTGLNFNRPRLLWLFFWFTV